MKEKLESLVAEMVDRRIYLDEALDEFEKKFGVRPIEGYGATELSPLVSVNVPYSRSHTLEVDCKEGSVGRPVPGVSVKVVDPGGILNLTTGWRPSAW